MEEQDFHTVGRRQSRPQSFSTGQTVQQVPFKREKPDHWFQNRAADGVHHLSSLLFESEAYRNFLTKASDCNMKESHPTLYSTFEL